MQLVYKCNKIGNKRHLYTCFTLLYSLSIRCCLAVASINKENTQDGAKCYFFKKNILQTQYTINLLAIGISSQFYWICSF